MIRTIKDAHLTFNKYIQVTYESWLHSKNNAFTHTFSCEKSKIFAEFING